MTEISLTDTQVSNWRHVLFGLIGPYAVLMPRADVEKLAKVFQNQMNTLANQVAPKNPFCECDQSHYGKSVGKDGVITCNNCKKERR